MQVSALTGAKLQAWIDATGQTGRNRFNTLRLVHSLLKWGQKRGCLPEGKLATGALAINPPTNDRPIEFFEPEELRKRPLAAKDALPPFVATGPVGGA